MTKKQSLYNLLIILFLIVVSLILSYRQINFDNIIDAYTYIRIAIGDENPLGYEINFSEPMIKFVLYPVGLFNNERYVLIWFTFLSSFIFYKALKSLKNTEAAFFVLLIIISSSTFFVLAGNLWRQYLSVLFFLFLLNSKISNLKFSILAIFSIASHITITPYIIILLIIKFPTAKYYLFSFLLFLIYYFDNSFANQEYRYDIYLNSAYENANKDTLRRLKLLLDLSLCFFFVQRGKLKEFVMLSGLATIIIPFPMVFDRLSHVPEFVFMFSLANLKKINIYFFLGLIIILFSLNIFSLINSETFRRSFGF